MLETLDLSIYAWLFLIGAGFFAGVLDSVAGGGGLISLPVVLMVGVPSHAALGCNKFMGVVGSFTATINFARSGKIIWKIVAIGICFSIAGSIIGTKLVLFLDKNLVGKIILGLLPFAAIASIIPRKPTLNDTLPGGNKLYIVTPILCFAIGMYDGFFGPATGSFLLLVIHLVLGIGLIPAAATAKPLNFASNITALVIFMRSGEIYYPVAIAMALSNIVGSIIGSRMALTGGVAVIKKMLLLSLVLLFCTLIYQYFFKQ